MKTYYELDIKLGWHEFGALGRGDFLGCGVRKTEPSKDKFCAMNFDTFSFSNSQTYFSKVFQKR